MRNRLTRAMMVLAAVLSFSLLAMAQYQNTDYDKLNEGPGGPAPSGILRAPGWGRSPREREKLFVHGRGTKALSREQARGEIPRLGDE